ncbi:MAG: hypothetical protein H6584_07430 [Flavobacteriales bacterium]|nr:hypothetical protein [Flavobacteriales bacterium]
MRIKTYLTADGPPNGWDTRDINYFKGCDLGNSRFPDSPGHGPCNTDGYQKWQGLTFHGDQSNKVDEFNLTNRKEGSYTLEIYFRIPGDYDGNNCDETEYDNNNGNPNNYRASYTICPTYSNGSKTDPTTCGGLDGVITLNYSGLVDGTDFYNGKFSHDGGAFPDGSVTVVNDVVTISGLSAGTYSNILYTSSVNGCGTVGGGTFVLTTDDLIPTAPVIGTITNPTCLVTTGSVQLSGLPSGNWIITETVTMTSIPGSGSSAAFTGLTASTTYRFTVTSDKNCTSPESANAIIGAVLSVPSTATVQTDCSGGFGNAVLTITNPTGAGFQYSLDGGVFQDSPIFSSVGNGSRVIRVKNSDGCISTTTTAEAPNLNVNCGCPPGDTPDVSLTTNSGSTCSITPVTINGTFMGNNVQVTSITTSNGAGVFDATSASTSPFSFTYTPDPSDIGKDIIINVVTNNPFGSPCTEGTAQYTLAVTDTQPPVVADSNQSFCVIPHIRTSEIDVK